MTRIRRACSYLIFLAGMTIAAYAQEPGATLPEVQAPSSSPSTVRPVRISSGVMAGLRISGDNPIYPAVAKEQGISGSVVLHAIISEDGHVQSLAVVSGNSVLAGAALDAVKTWVYRPFLLNGERKAVDTTITVNFNLP